MNETTHHKFFDDYTIAMHVLTKDADHGGYPSIEVKVIPRDADNPKDSMERGRKLIFTAFGGGPFQFFNPDGSLYVQLSEAPTDDDTINGDLNEAWTGARDSGLMELTHEALSNTVMSLIAAKALAGASGGSASDVFNRLMSATKGVKKVVPYNEEMDQ